MNISESIRLAAKVVPSKRQVEWQKTEFYAFFHFGVNTYTNREWGTGREDPAIFNPEKFDADQWINAVKKAGMKGIIITAKHHDGFCLWQTETTDHSVKNSPWRNGKGDVVKDLSEAAKRGGLKFGVYLSPWDMHEKTYGDSEKYNAFYIRQLTELCTNYGELFSIWFDGACGEGENGRKQVYDWDAYLEVCNRLQPNAVQFNFGDVRWCGNEAGACRAAEWSVVPAFMASQSVILSHAQKAEDIDGSFRKRVYSVTESDLGSREVIEGEKEFIWYPCETNTSIRPGWFYHPEEDDKVRSLEELMDIYYNSVGGNSTFLLNIPPDKNGLLHENDVRRLEEIGAELTKAFEYNLCRDIDLSHLAVNDGDFTDPISIDVDLKMKTDISKVVLMENITVGQRVENFIIEAEADGIYKRIYEGQTVGYKRIAVLKEKVHTDRVRITITSSRLNPAIAFVGVY